MLINIKIKQNCGYKCVSVDFLTLERFLRYISGVGGLNLIHIRVKERKHNFFTLMAFFLLPFFSESPATPVIPDFPFPNCQFQYVCWWSLKPLFDPGSWRAWIYDLYLGWNWDGSEQRNWDWNLSIMGEWWNLKKRCNQGF